MNETHSAIGESNNTGSQMSLVEFLTVLARHKKLVIGMPVIVGLLAVAISLALPNVYKAGTKLLPPQQPQSSAAALLSQLGGVAGAAAGVGGLKNPNDLYIGMLRSRTVADKIIARFDLKKVYDTDSQERARKTLETNTVIISGKDGLISIDVEDEDKKMVAKLANSYTEELLKLTKVLAVTEASSRRLFFERQLENSKNNLADAEAKLKESLDTHGVISVDADSRAIVETVGRLRAQISVKEIQLATMRAFVTTNNQDFKRAQEELQSLKAELSRLENGRRGTAAPVSDTEKKPSGLDNIKVLRDVKYHQMLYELLAKQYEIARLDEAKDASIIQVLDEAIEPERKFKPRRAIIVIIATLLSFFIAVLTAFGLEARSRLLLWPERSEPWKRLRAQLWRRGGN